ncbi:MAG: phenylalanine--tRNA ligase subunit beta [Clostridium sp.]|nr:phenylalanine--tRNA ligase subunit beta [Clostridium sp.]
MNISYKWLKQYIDFDLSPERLAEVLTSAGLETGSVEEVESVKGGLRGLVIGRVLTCVEHPDSDHLHITTVDLGDGQPTQIVCGAPNVAAGQTVVVATVGTTLYDGDKEFQIKKSKIRGVESFGMICAEDEIGVGNSHDGIIVITDREVAPGTPAAEYFGLSSDFCLEVDLTPNRIDAASHFGVARDIAAWLKCHAEPRALTLPDISAFASQRPDGATPVEVLDTEGCLRYCGVTIRGVRVAESPEWLRQRLTAVGQRPINNIVDITNYILLGLGQPLHCFDLAKVKGNRIVVRPAEEGQTFTTLDGVERKLSAADMMICNAEEPMCIAGVFGGLDSGVTEQTADIFLESACFHPTRVRKTARRHGLSTDASFRFERGVDPNLALYALKVAALLVREIAGGEICGPVSDHYPAPALPYPVELSYKYLNSLIGKEISRETVDSILESLEISITPTADDDVVSLQVPTYRYDVRRPCDVVEEVLRIYGYNNIEISDRVHSSLSYKSVTDSVNDLSNAVADQLSAAGFNEIMNNSLTASAYYDDNATYPAEACIRLLNPLSSELNAMRQTLLYGGLESLAHNLNRREEDLKFYEFGNVYRRSGAESTAEAPLAPFSEEYHLALWVTGAWRKASWLGPEQPSTFWHLKAEVENIFARLGIDSRELKLTTAGAGELTSSSIDVATRSGKHLGTLGIVAKRLLKEFDIRQEVYYAEFDMGALCRLALRRNVSFTPLPRTHPVKRDLALLVDTRVAMAEIETVVRESERKLLRSVELFDVYEDPAHLPEGKKSYAIAMTIQDNEKTLNDKAIDAVMNKIIANLRKRLGAELR